MDGMQDVERIASEAISAHLADGRVRQVKAEPYSTSFDQEGLRIRLVIADDDPLPTQGDTVLDTMLDVSDRLATAGENRPAMINLITEEELAHIGDPDL